MHYFTRFVLIFGPAAVAVYLLRADTPDALVIPAALLGAVLTASTVDVLERINTRGPVGWRPNLAGRILWHAGALSDSGKARAFHPLAWVAFAITIVAYAAAGVYEAIRDTRRDWVAW